MLYIVRGLPGVGKSTIGAMLTSQYFAADDYFEGPNGYEFDPSKLPEAHQQCQDNVREALANGFNVAVCNTFTQRWEMEPYLQMVRSDPRCNWAYVTVVDLFDGGQPDAELVARGLHGVPEAAIAAMRGRYEHNWKDGDPRPPWERG